MKNPPEIKRRCEIVRHIFHILCMSSVAFSAWYVEFDKVVTILSVLVLTLIPLDFLRKHVPILQLIANFLFGKLMRNDESNKLSGASYALLGGFICFVIFPREVATISILMFALGDPISNFVGTRYGKDKIIGNKTLQGTIACFVICMIISFFYVSIVGEISFERYIVIGMLAGCIGAITELVPILKFNDNFTMPTLSGCGIWILFISFGII